MQIEKAENIMDPELDELRREFLAEAGDKVSEIQAALDGERTSESLGRMTYLAHQLKGSGGSYGFERISADAAGLEKAVEQLADGEPADRLEASIQQHVINLRAEIDSRSRELALAS